MFGNAFAVRPIRNFDSSNSDYDSVQFGMQFRLIRNLYRRDNGMRAGHARPLRDLASVNLVGSGDGIARVTATRSKSSDWGLWKQERLHNGAEHAQNCRKQRDHEHHHDSKHAALVVEHACLKVN